MTDRELLELAAKAAGIDGRIKEWVNAGPDFIRPEGDVWNPLEDDGDALRLAVKLHIHIEHAGRSSEATDRVQASPRGHGHLGWVQMYEKDPFAATRYAIVRAAYELGRAML